MDWTRIRTTTVGVTVVGALTLGSCSDVSAPEQDLTTAFSTRDPWCGGVLQVSASRYGTMAQAPRFRVDTVVLASRSVGPTTIELTLPSTLCGDTHIIEESSLGTLALPPITSHGFVERFTVLPGLLGSLEVWPRGGQASIIGATAKGVGVLRPATRSITEYRGIHSWFYGGRLEAIGMSYDAAKVLLNSPDGSVYGWYLNPVPVLADTNPVLLGSGSPQYLLEAAPGRLLHGAYSERILFTGPTGTVEAVAVPKGLLLSPTGARATVRAFSSFGIPVFDVPSGSLAYLVTSLYSSPGAEFSDDGDRLYLAGAGRNSFPDNFLGSLHSNDGSLIFLEPLPRLQLPFSLALDPSAALVYVVGRTLEGGVTVQVHHQVSGALVATLDFEIGVPDPCFNFDWLCSWGALVVDGTTNNLFFVPSGVVDGNPDQTTVYQFSLPPDRGLTATP